MNTKLFDDTHSAQILEVLADWPQGLTIEQVEGCTGLESADARAGVKALEEEGRAADTGIRRRTCLGGRMARVWAATATEGKL